VSLCCRGIQIEFEAQLLLWNCPLARERIFALEAFERLLPFIPDRQASPLEKQAPWIILK
jgi:hypothetical protein